MPGLVSGKTPSRAPSPSPIFVSGSHEQNQKNQYFNGHAKSASPSNPRPRPSRKTAEKLAFDESSLDNPDLGPFLLKHARDMIASGDNPNKALEYAIRASKSFERCSGPGLELAMSLHVVAAIYCSLGKLGEAVPVLQRSIKVPNIENGFDHALTKFSGFMQLGDTYSMLGQLDQSISCYEAGLKIQMEALGESDPRFAETCR